MRSHTILVYSLHRYFFLNYCLGRGRVIEEGLWYCVSCTKETKLTRGSGERGIHQWDTTSFIDATLAWSFAINKLPLEAMYGKEKSISNRILLILKAYRHSPVGSKCKPDAQVEGQSCNVIYELGDPESWYSARLIPKESGSFYSSTVGPPCTQLFPSRDFNRALEPSSHTSFSEMFRVLCIVQCCTRLVESPHPMDEEACSMDGAPIHVFLHILVDVE